MPAGTSDVGGPRPTDPPLEKTRIAGLHNLQDYDGGVGNRTLLWEGAGVPCSQKLLTQNAECMEDFKDANDS